MKVIIIVSVLLFCTVGGASAWYDGFDYRIPITIDNVGNPALEDYQFNVSFSPGINETSIRVVNDTDYTIVPHWCENGTVGLCYELWFNVSVGSEVNTDYYIYYGNDSIPSTSDYDSTFTKKYNDSGLVLELHMDEGTGNSVTVDSSGEGNHGTLTNMNVTGNATSGWQGVDGGQWDNRSDMVFATGDHLWVDGANDYVDCGNGPVFEDVLTISAWISPNAITGNQHIVTKTFYTFFRIEGDELTLGLYIDGAVKYAKSTGGDFKIGRSYHVAAAYDKNDGSNVTTLYINGVEPMYAQQDNTGGGSIAPTSESVLIGKRNDGSPYYGSIDDVRIYNRSLSEDEIYRQYIRSKYAANTPLISIGYTEEIPHPFLSGAYLFYGEMIGGLTNFKNEMSTYLIWGVLFCAVGLAFAIFAKIKATLIGGK